MRKTEVILNKPRYVGAAVLNISKTVMYDFAYYWLDKYKGSKLCFTDTDSLCFWTPYNGNIYKGEKSWFSSSYNTVILDIKSDPWIDFSNYPKPKPSTTKPYDIGQNYSEEKKLVPGFFKDDMGGEVITEFVGLRFIFSFLFMSSLFHLFISEQRCT